MTQEEIDQLQSKAWEQFKEGKSLFAKDGAFAPMPKQFLETALEAEMWVHLDEQQLAIKFGDRLLLELTRNPDRIYTTRQSLNYTPTML